MKAKTWDELLKEWKLSQYIQKFEDQGYDIIDVWDELDSNTLIQDIGLKSGHAKLFLKKRDEFWNNNKKM